MVQFLAGARDFCLLESVQSDAGSQIASTGGGGLFIAWVQQPILET